MYESGNEVGGRKGGGKKRGRVGGEGNGGGGRREGGRRDGWWVIEGLVKDITHRTRLLHTYTCR